MWSFRSPIGGAATRQFGKTSTISKLWVQPRWRRWRRTLGIPASDLRELARHCSDAADLLERRLAALGMNASELAATAPAELRDMERLCQSKGRCARDLGADASDPVWRQYCPNEQTLVALAHEGLER